MAYSGRSLTVVFMSAGVCVTQTFQENRKEEKGTQCDSVYLEMYTGTSCNAADVLVVGWLPKVHVVTP